MGEDDTRVDRSKPRDARRSAVSGDPRRGPNEHGKFSSEPASDAPEDRFRELADAIPHLVWSTDPEGWHDYFNHRWYEYTGTTLEQVQGSRWMVVLHPDDVEPTRHQWRHSVETGEVYSTEYRLRSSSGEYRWFLARAEPIRNASGEIVRWLGTCTDIDDQRRAETALRESRERFDRIIDSVEVGVWYCDLPVRTLHLDTNCRRHFGLHPDAEVTIDIFYARLHPDDRERTEKAIASSILNRQPLDIQYRVVAEDGEIRWIRAIGHVFCSEDGRPTRFDGVTLDISGQKRSEDMLRESRERLQAALDASDIGIFRWDFHSGTLDSDARLRHMFGLGPLDEMRGLPAFLRHIHPDDRSSVSGAVKRSAGAGVDLDLEFRAVLPDGSIRWLAEKGRTVRAQDGRPLYLTGACTDLTERRLGEEAVRQAQKLESLGVLAGGIAHDFNNLLVGIMGNASMVQDSLPQDHPDWQRLQAVVRASERAADLTRQLLAYAGKGQFLFESVHLSELVREISALIETSVPRRVKLVIELADDLPLLEADRGQVQQVVMNLILNGTEATPVDQQGMVRVTTHSRRYTLPALAGFTGPAAHVPGVYVALQVQDTGVGMDSATMARIFDPFFTTKFTGRGLGLSAVQGIVRAARGGLRVASGPGAGTTFTVIFPAASREVDAPEAQPAGNANTERGAVLVVDQHAAARDATSKALERYGYRVLGAPDHQSALAALESHGAQIQSILLDLAGQGKGPAEALERIQSVRPDVPVLVSGSPAETDAVRRFQRRNIAGFIEKPCTVGRMAEEIVAALLRRRDPA